MKVKTFLKDNEIYFKTITSLLLGLMAIIVAYNSNTIANEQKRMSYYENTPDFHISQERKRDSAGNIREVAVKVAKFGGKAKNVSLNIKSYALFEIFDEQNNKLSKYIPIHGYFNESYITGENKGSIRLLKGLDNNKKFIEFKRIMNTELIKKGYTYVNINPLFIVKISYTDFLDNEKKEYYDISLDDGVLIKEDNFKIELFDNKRSSIESIPVSGLENDKIESYLKMITNTD